MEPIFSDMDYDEDLRDLFVQAATRITCSAIEAKLLHERTPAEETAENVLLFFETAFRRIQEVAEEDYLEEDDSYLEEETENGESEPI